MKKRHKIYYYNIGVHNYMKCLLDNPPRNYEFIVNNDQVRKNKIDFLKKYGAIRFLYKNILKRTFNVFNLLNKTYYVSSPRDADMIFSTGVIIKEEKPWVLKILDTPFSMAGNDYNVFIRNKDSIEKALASNHCKRIIVHTQRARTHMELYFSKEVTNKIIKIDPAIPGKISKKTKKDKKIRFLFMGSINNPNEFFMKGGIEALETFKELLNKYPDIVLTVRCKVPEKIKEKYKSDKINFIENQLEYSEIINMYKESDALIMPGYGGYFIMAYLEAFSHGIPIIALDTYGVREFVIEGKTGFVVKPSEKAPINDPDYPANTRSKKFVKSIEEKDPKVISELVDKCAKFIENDSLRKKMSEECQRAFQTTYSFERKIQKLKKIFDAALKERKRIPKYL